MSEAPVATPNSPRLTTLLVFMFALFIMFDLISTNAAAFNHVPGGSNVLYMDGHVEFMRYEQNGEAPVNGPMAQLIGMFTAM